MHRDPSARAVAESIRAIATTASDLGSERDHFVPNTRPAVSSHILTAGYRDSWRDLPPPQSHQSSAPAPRPDIESTTTRLFGREARESHRPPNSQLGRNHSHHVVDNSFYRHGRRINV